jgi:hypothetical protein
MNENPYRAPEGDVGTPISNVEVWRKLTLAGFIATSVATLGIVVTLITDFALVKSGTHSHLNDLMNGIMCSAAPVGLLLWTFCSVLLLRARRREQ